MKLSRLHKLILVPLLILVLMSQNLAPFAGAFSFPDRYDLVAILVEQGMYQDTQDYDGLAPQRGAPLRSTTLKSRIDRYATDIQNKLPDTRVLIIQVDRFEKLENIASVLEKLYTEGDPKEPNRTAYLKGVVLVGEVPLPVVNKNGTRFISLYPYTDFVARAYIWDGKDFVFSTENPNPQPELWHGVVRHNSPQEIATFFDKNHLYHSGDSAYANFSKRVFFQDFWQEQKNLNPIAYKNYEQFINHWEDISYYRYTKELFADLSGPMEAELAADAAESQQLIANLAQYGIATDSSVPAPQIPADAPQAVKDAAAGRGQQINKNEIPDIMTKIAKMSDNLMLRFNQIFTKYPNLINDFIKSTGRYTTLNGTDLSVDVDSAVNLITAKDAYTIEYLRAVNDMVEARIDQLVNQVQKNFPIVEVTIEPQTTVRRRPDGSTVQESGGEELTFVNFSPEFEASPLGATSFIPPLTPSSALLQYPDHLNGYYMTSSINGHAVPELVSVSQCSPYRGSQASVTQTSGAYSKLVELNRAFNMQSGAEYDVDNELITGRNEKERNENYQCNSQDTLTQDLGEPEACEGYEHFGGCFYDNRGHITDNPPPRTAALQDPQICFPEHARNPVFDPSGTRRVTTTPPPHYDDYNYCSVFYEKDQYIEYLRSVDERLEEFDDDYDAQRAEKITILQDNPLEQKEKAPTQVELFSYNPLLGGDPSFQIMLSDLLRGLGWNPQTQPNEWRAVLTNFLISWIDVNSAQEQTVRRTVQLNHQYGVSMDIELTAEMKKSLSSVFYHKEPTNETLNRQAVDLISKDLPVDDPRYVTFQDQAGNTRRMVYPNIFDAQSPQEFLTALTVLETQLNSLPRQGAQTAAPLCQNCLTSLMSDLQELPLTQGPATTLQRANRSKTLDAIAWRNFNLEAKHAYILEYYLDPTKNAYVGESPQGYELLYLHGEGESGSGYEFSVTPQDNDADTDPVLAQAKQARDSSAKNLEEREDLDDPRTNVASGGYDLFSFSPPPISPWWEKMKEWSASLKKDFANVKIGDSASDFYGALEAENKAALEAIKKESRDVLANPLTADELDFSKVKQIELIADSHIAVTGTHLQLQLRLLGSDGKEVQGEITRINLRAEVFPRELNDAQTRENIPVGTRHVASLLVEDENPAEEGTQFTMLSGSRSFAVAVPDIPADVKLTAHISGTEKKAMLTLRVVEKASLSLESATRALVADSAGTFSITVTARDDQNAIINSMQGTVTIGLSDASMGTLSASTLKLTNGQGQLTLRTSTKSGTLTVLASSGSMGPGALDLTLLPGPPVSLILSAESDTLAVSPGSTLPLTVGIADQYGNSVDTNNSAQISLRLTQKTTRYGLLSAATTTLTNGSATVNLSPTDKTGTVTVIAESTGLTPASLTIKAKTQFGAQVLSRLSVEALTAALLGIPAGDITQRDFLGGTVLARGKVQAVTTLTAQPKVYKKLFEVSDKGGLSFSAGTRVAATFVPENNFSLILTDTQANIDLAQLRMLLSENGQFEVTEVEDLTTLADGIYIKKIDTSDSYKVDKVKGALRLTKDSRERLEVQTNGFTRIFDNAFSLRPRSAEFLTLDVFDSETLVAQIYFVQRFNQDVRLQGGITQAPGVYMEAAKIPPHYKIEKSFTGSSSNAPRGVAIFDAREEVRGPQVPGFSSLSLEDSFERFGVGFVQDNKFALLFSAGETFGEANRPYASEIGIVLGDPVVRINNETPGSFSKDIGKFLYAAGAQVRGILGFDYNTDGFEDILIVEGEGKIRLIQNNGGYDKLKDQGFILEVKNGIADFAKADYNNDGQMDLIIAGTDSCRKGDTCIDIYENQSGAFVRKNLRFNQIEKVVTLKSQDMNNDSFADLLMADTAGDIKILYNKNGQFDPQAKLVGNVGVQVDPGKNLAASVLLAYDAMPAKNPQDAASLQSFQTLSVLTKSAAPGRQAALQNIAVEGAEVRVDAPQSYTERDFIFADLDTGAFGNSTKFGEDLNGGVVKTGDTIAYTVTVNNASAATKTNVYVSDVVGQQLMIDEKSVQCGDCGQGEFISEPLNADVTRPILFKIARVPARSVRTITYQATYKGTTDTADKITLITSTNFQDAGNAALTSRLGADRYPDISVTKEGNPTGQVRFFYTTGVDRNGFLTFSSELSSPPGPADAQNFAQKTGLSVPTAADYTNIPQVCRDSNEDEIRGVAPTTAACRAAGGKLRPKDPPTRATQELRTLQNADSDGDGLQDTIDNIQGGLSATAQATQAVVDKLTCDAGCIAMPINMAFFAPGPFSVLGVPGAYDIGLPVFGWGAPSLVPTWPPMPPITTLGGRFYISPTLTGGVGFGLCLGPYATPKNCFSFGINPLDLLPGNICDAINGAVSGALSFVNEGISTINEGLTVSIGGGGGSTGTQSRRSQGSGLGNYSLGSYESPVTTSRNIRIPGFPSFLTEWLSRQWEEITDKALSLPDLYLIYPDPDSLIGSFQATQDFDKNGDLLTSVLSYVNSVPLINIETQPVLFKIPFISRKEIEKLKADALQWIEDVQHELNNFRQLFSCVDALAGTNISGRGGENAQLCQFVTVEIGGLVNAVAANMRALDEWILFPKKIMQYRAIESYYLRQIIDYMDTIIDYTGGWVKKNTTRVKLWRRAIRQIKQTIEDWKAIVDIMIEYNESCDQCKTERFTLKELILKVFIAIPIPPVIPMPKLPDIVVDVSKVQAGLTVLWPDVQFKVEPFTIPKLPRISLGANLDLPLFKLSLPKIPVIPGPPELPELPELPALQLPKLPDLPPPPTLPALPGEIHAVIDVLKQIVKILCIIRLGLIPTDEVLLKPRMEEITARGLSPVLPIDLLLTITSPTINVQYVDQISVTAFTNLQFDFSFVQQLVEAVAGQANKFSTGLTDKINTFNNTLFKQLEKVTSPALPLPRQLNYTPSEKELLARQLSQLTGTDAPELVDLGLTLRSLMNGLEKARVSQAHRIAQIPKELLLSASSEKFVARADKNPTYYSEGELVLPFQRHLKEYRDSLIAHVERSEKLGSSGLAEDFEGFNSYIASLKSPFISPNFKSYVAAQNADEIMSSSGGAKVRAGELNLENVSWLDEDTATVSSSRLLAQLSQTPPAQPVSSSGNQPQFNDRGLFFIDTNGQSTRLVNYTLELDKPSKLADIDIESDGDMDKLYSYGNNVFLKKSERVIPRRPVQPQYFRPTDIEYWTVFELLPHAAAPIFPKSLDESAHEASLSFKNEPSSSIVGYEVISKHSPLYFENASRVAAKTLRTHLVPEPHQAPQPLDATVTLIDPDGAVRINKESPKNLTAKIGDYIETGKDSSVQVVASDMTELRLSQETGFTLTHAGTFELIKGALEIDVPENSLLFPAGTTFKVSEGSLRLRLPDGSDLELTGGESFTLPQYKEVFARVKSVRGDAVLSSSKRTIVDRAVVHLNAGDIVHALEVSRVVWNADTSQEKTLSLSASQAITVPEAFAAGIDIEVSSGAVEIITDEKSTQALASGMQLAYGDRVEVRSGEVIVSYKEGGDTTLKSGETFTLLKTENLKNPTLNLALDPAFYFSKIYSFDAEGNRSNVSEPVLLAPQVCGDTSSPFANFGKAQFTVAVGKTLVLDASKSFDSMSNVVSYTLDTDSTADSNNDTVPHNDKNLFKDTDFAVDSDHDGNSTNDGDSSQFVLGPYTQVGRHLMRLTVKDEALNEGYQDITVDVVTPRIVLEEPPLRSGVIEGFVEPPEENVPISIARLRADSPRGWELFTTPSADTGGQYYTDAAGRFKITDADLALLLVVRNSEGKIVAEVDQQTGDIIIKDERYETRAMPATSQVPATRLGLFLKTDTSTENPLTYTYAIADVNSDTEVVTAGDRLKADGVKILPLQPALSKQNLTLRVLPSNDASLPGATVLEDSAKKRLAVVDVNGAIVPLEVAVSVRAKKAAVSVYELVRQAQPIAEVYINARLGLKNQIEIINAPKIAARPGVQSIQKTSPQNPFSDVAKNDPFSAIINNLYQRGIVAGYPSNVKGQLLFKPENRINRAEFTQITMKMLCIVPREEAKKLPSPFYDVLDRALWFYPVLKEGNIRGFIRGYLGESRVNGQTGLLQTPFKPAANITRAEAVTVVLAALDEENIIDLSKADLKPRQGRQWYDRYIEVAQNITPYLVDSQDKNRAFLITAQEAAAPDVAISRKDFATMADRVLLIYDCTDPDTDDDALPDSRDLNPNDDPDGDGLINAQELTAGSNPFDPDTDKGGVKDGEEVRRGTNPADNPFDDKPTTPSELGKPTEGIFVLRPDCGNVCPCRATLEPAAALAPRDRIFAAITGAKGLPIYAKSNEEEY